MTQKEFEIFHRYQDFLVGMDLQIQIHRLETVKVHSIAVGLPAYRDDILLCVHQLSPSLQDIVDQHTCYNMILHISSSKMHGYATSRRQADRSNIPQGVHWNAHSLFLEIGYHNVAPTPDSIVKVEESIDRVRQVVEDMELAMKVVLREHKVRENKACIV